ncbi:MAG: flagellar protein FliS [Firmicutes bacterium]|nr:flagellar protein FliS [Bacillota bacterium]
MSYRAQQVMSASPERLVLIVYDQVLASCKARDAKKASSGLATLIDALDFDTGDVALGLFRLYRYAMEKIKEQKFDEAASIIRSLRDAWCQAACGCSGAGESGGPRG